MPKHINSNTIKFLIKYNADKITQDVSADLILKLIDEMPGIEIIRCRDCKYVWEHENGCFECGNGFCEVTADFFCADGERRESE